MKKKINYIFGLIFVFTLNTYAQDFKSGDVTIEEIAFKTSSTEPNVNAEYISMIGKSEVAINESGFKCVTEIEGKLKIFKKEGIQTLIEGLGFSMCAINYDKAYFDKINVYSIDNGNIKKTKIESTINEIKFNSCREINFKLPEDEIPIGSIIEFKIIIHTNEPTMLPTWYFQKEVPVLYSKFITSIPEILIYETKLIGNLMPEIKKDFDLKDVKFWSKNRKMLFNIITYELKNIPSNLKDEPFARNANNFSTRIIHELKSMQFNGKKLEIPNSWEELSKIFNKIVEERYSKFNFDQEKELKNSISDIMTENEKIERIFKYVQNQFMFDECSEELEVKKIYASKKGTSFDINLILATLLRKYGINAHPILLCTRDSGVYIFPTFSSINYMLVGIENGENLQLLDASDKNSVQNILPERALNYSGRLIRKDNTSIDVDLFPNFLSNKSINIVGEINNNGTISANIREQHTGYFAMQKRKTMSNTGLEKYSVNNGQHSQIKGLQNFKVSFSEDSKDAFIENYTYDTALAFENNKYNINPLFFLKDGTNPFVEENRNFPIDLLFSQMERYLISLKIPDGFVIEKIPVSLNLNLPDNLGEFQIKTDVSNGNIQLMYLFKMNESLISTNYYSDVKKYFQTISEKLNEKIVLRRK